MEQEKVKYLVDMINNMDIKDKLRLAICMSQSKWSGLIYNTKEYYEKLVTDSRVFTLSNASLEVLAIIAYNEPITRVRIDEIRGVSSSQIVR